MTQLVLQGQSGLIVQHSVVQQTRHTIHTTVQYINAGQFTQLQVSLIKVFFFDDMQKFFVYFSLFGKLDCNLPTLTL